MKAWVFVEGPSDKLGLIAFWNGWILRLRRRGAGIEIIPLKSKSHFLAKIGIHAAEKLVARETDVVVGLPDLYPIMPDGDSSRRHATAIELKELQRNAVRRSLIDGYGLSKKRATSALERFCPSLFKHDFEMLLLAAKEQLRETLRTSDALGGWRIPVEEQDLTHPPKRVVEELFRTKLKRSYLDTTHAPAVLRRVIDIAEILTTPSGQITCPEFVSMLNWLGERIGEQCCTIKRNKRTASGRGG